MAPVSWTPIDHELFLITGQTAKVEDLLDNLHGYKLIQFQSLSTNPRRRSTDPATCLIEVHRNDVAQLRLVAGHLFG